MFPTWLDISVGLSNMVLGCVPPMVRYKCRSFLTWFLYVFLPWLDISVEPFRHGGRLGLPWSDISAEPFRHGGRLALPWLDISDESF